MESFTSSVVSAPLSTFTPAGEPPPGVTPNPESPESQIFLSNIVVGICISFATVFFLARSYVRIRIKRSWIVEDWLVLTAWASTVAYCVLASVVMRHHEGEHIWDITASQAQEAAYWFNMTSILYSIVICIAKVAVLCLYRRVFSPRRWSYFDLSIVFLIVVMVLFYTITFFIKIFECTPREKINNPSILGTCLSSSDIISASGIFNTITDFLILLLPVQAVWSLKTTFGKKIIVVLAFTFGFCAPISSIAGLVSRVQVSQDTDQTWYAAIVGYWSLTECAVAVICVCFPETAALFRSSSESRGRARYPRLTGPHEPFPAMRLHDSEPRADIPSRVRITRETGQLLEILDHQQYRAHATASDRLQARDPQDEGIHIDREITVVSLPAA